MVGILTDGGSRAGVGWKIKLLGVVASGFCWANWVSGCL